MSIALLQKHRVEIQSWLTRNMRLRGTVQFSRVVRADRLLCDLVARKGGRDVERAYVLNELVAINRGDRDRIT